MQEILLKDLFNKITPNRQMDYKIHFAKRASEQPLDVFVRDMETWKWWNRSHLGKNDFNREYIFSLIDFYPESDTWLFGGIWVVTDRDFSDKDNKFPYQIELSDNYKEYIGRLKISYSYDERNCRVKMENHFDNMVVKEILQETYSVKVFPGYRNIHETFGTLENIVKKDAPAWKNDLSVKGIYLICDVKTGKKYVGSAYSEGGIWKRWCEYISNGHGGNVKLKELVNEKGFDYVKENYMFTLIELLGGWEEKDVIDRESHWKNVLLSRSDFNKN